MSRESRPLQPISGHVFRVDRRRGPQWYAKYRLPDGRQVQRRIGPAWTGRGRPASGWFTKRSAQAWLDDLLIQARRGELPGMVETGATVADAAAEWLRWAEHDRDCKPSTLADYRSTSRLIVRALGELRLEDVTPQLLERWKTTIPGSIATCRSGSSCCTASSGARCGSGSAAESGGRCRAAARPGVLGRRRVSHGRRSTRSSAPQDRQTACAPPVQVCVRCWLV